MIGMQKTFLNVKIVMIEVHDKSKDIIDTLLNSREYFTQILNFAIIK